MLETRLNIVVKEKEILYNENEALKQKLTTYTNKSKKQENDHKKTTQDDKENHFLHHFLNV
jgi:regulator of replication initiation timing